MIAKIVAACTDRPWVVLTAAALLATLGVVAWTALDRGAIPDLSSPQITLVADWMGHPAAEVARDVTNPLAALFEGVAGATTVRGSSMSGMAYVDVVFDSPSDLEPGRRAIEQRVARARLPPTARVTIGPVTASSGWVLQYALVDPHRRQSGLVMRRLQDDVLKPALASVPGVAEVASVGGTVQQVLVELELDRLRAHGVAYSDVVDTVRSALRDRGSPSPAELSDLHVSMPAGSTASAPRVGDLGNVHIADDMPTGLADYRGIQPAVGGIVVAQRGAKLDTLLDGARAVLEAERAHLPAGIELVTTYDRSDLVGRVERTFLRALSEEVAVVVVVAIVFLVHGRSAVVPLVTLPLALLLTFSAMWLLRVPATILSLGGVGIALGLAVDADIVALEACHRAVEAGGGASLAERRAKLLAAAGSLAPAIVTSLVISALAFLPVFGFTGEAGRLVRPLAMTKTLVIGAAALVSITVAPALRSRLLTGQLPGEFDNPITRTLVGVYRPFVHFALSRPAFTLCTAALALISCVPIVGRLGGEFLPRIDEGDLLFMPSTLAGAPPELTATELFRQDRVLRDFPEVTTIFGKVGRADTATDPAPYSMAETIVRLRPRSEWPSRARERWHSRWAPRGLRSVLGLVWPETRAETLAELVQRLDRATRMPGWVSAWTSPARGRMDMMATGVRTPLAVRVVASDPARLDALGTFLRDAVASVPGTRGAAFESLGGEPWIDFELDPGSAANWHVDPDRATSTAHLLVTGGQVGDVEYEGRPLRVRITPDANMHAMMGGLAAEPLRGAADQLRAATVRPVDEGPPVPLVLLGHTRFVPQPAQIRTERGETTAYVYVDVAENVDLSTYVDRAKQRVEAALATGKARLLAGERIEWTGQYELLEAGQRRLTWIAPLVVLSMFGLLWLQFRSVAECLIVLASVPFALVGSFWTLFFLSYPLSAPVWLGLLSTAGLAMQTGVVMVVYIDEAFYRRVREGRITIPEDIVEAHAEGTVRRLRPKIMTVATMAASLLPLLWGEGAGSEIMKRVAAPMVGGLVTSSLLTLEVIPVVYTLWRRHQLRRAQRDSVSVASVVGAMPGWAKTRRGWRAESCA